MAPFKSSQKTWIQRLEWFPWKLHEVCPVHPKPRVDGDMEARQLVQSPQGESDPLTELSHPLWIREHHPMIVKWFPLETLASTQERAEVPLGSTWWVPTLSSQAPNTVCLAFGLWLAQGVAPHSFWMTVHFHFTSALFGWSSSHPIQNTPLDVMWL